MPSPMSIPVKRQAAVVPWQLQVQEYRQTVYHDGTMRHVAESRRHPRTIDKVEAPHQAYADWVLYPEPDVTAFSYEHLVGSSLCSPIIGRSSQDATLARHVTPPKRLSKAKPIIVQTSKSDRSTSTKIQSSYYRSAGPTPPPTPRPSRLPTPDLSDLEEGALCDCGVKAHIVKYCTSCKKQSNSWSI